MEMNKKLLIELIYPQNARLIIEGKTPDGRTILKGKLQEADVKNGNGRVYPKSILEQKVTSYRDRFVKNRTSLGELDHPESQIVNLQNASHIITEIWWNGNDVLGKIELLPTPSGKIAQAIVESNIPLGISSRAMGSVKQIGENVEVQDDLEFVCWDLVSNPSTPNAFMGLNENINYQNEQYKKLNRIISEILYS